MKRRSTRCSRSIRPAPPGRRRKEVPDDRLPDLQPTPPPARRTAPDDRPNRPPARSAPADGGQVGKTLPLPTPVLGPGQPPREQARRLQARGPTAPVGAP